jgi:hypothetical protein
MDIREFITNLLSDKPHLGILASMAGFSTAMLTWFHVITVAFGLVGAFFGAAAGFYTFLIKRKEWRTARLAKAAATPVP